MIEIDHVHFYVNNRVKLRNFLTQKLGFSLIYQKINNDTCTEIVGNNLIFLLFLLLLIIPVQWLII